jgi:hypothetical protein
MRVRWMLAGVSAGVAAGMAVSEVRRWRQTWGMDPDETTRALPGDEVVADPVASETRGITIAATPDRIWPWLVQMGFGKAGWYSYDQLDQRGASADEIVEAWSTLKVGDILPTHPGGGFEVVDLQPDRALVLRSDSALVQAQAAAWAARTGTDPTEVSTRGVAASGAILGQTPQQFSASWAFVIEPLEGGRSRLIERFRVWYGESGVASHVVMPAVGFGVFVMMQRQMTGIRTRAERATTRPSPRPAPILPEAPLATPPPSGEPTAPKAAVRTAAGPQLVTAEADH